jgi:hypothetical protein
LNIESIAAAFVAAQMGRVQMAAAAKMMKVNADVSADIAKLLEAAQQNLQQLANTATGVGTNLDLTV